MPAKNSVFRRTARHPRLTAIRLAALCGLLAAAAQGPATAAADQPVPEIDGDFAAAILMDARTGEILAGKNIDERRQPASMVKMMTQLIVLERIAEGDIAIEDTVTTSARASRQGGSQVWLKHREQFTVEQMLEALAIHSANDVAVALAEHIAGSVEAFIDLMNVRAAELGMQDTEFNSVHGLPPSRGKEPDLTTPRDMATLGRALLEHPQTLVWSSQATAPFRGGAFTLYNPNRLVGRFRGLDGLKTGYHGQAGYCVTATAVQKGVRLLSVVMGCPTDAGRATETTRLLSYGFNLYTPVTLIAKGAAVDGAVEVTGGRQREVTLVAADDLVVALPRDREERVEWRREIAAPVAAPVAAGQALGELVALLDGHELGRVEIRSAAAVDKGSWFHRLLR
jgi:serine-type D-Ala-D-Ala carboxypeptidase (penicillin-binding protein 5/6)